MKELLELLKQYKGEIVSTASLSTEFIAQARASGRMWVDDNGFGFVWEPDINRIPETEAEVEFFERWYPLEVEFPPELSAENLFKKMKEKRDILKQKKQN